MNNILRRLCAEFDPTSSIVISDPSEMAAYTTDWTRKFSGDAQAILRPRDTKEVVQCVLVCQKLGLRIVPQGGNTSMVGGSVPRNGEVILNLSRLNRIENFNAPSAVVQVQSGVVLQTLHEYLAEQNHRFPVDLGARGSCQIGGMIATNAGGIKVLRYGHMREQVLGLEVVLADGTVLCNLNSLKKNNTGLDLKHIFVGSEGILGIITRAVLQVHPVSRGIQTALLALPNLENIPELLTLLRHELSGLSSLEVITRGSIDLYKEIEPNTREPFDQIYPACLIVEEETGHGEKDEEYFLESLSKILDTGLIADVLVAQGDSQAKKIWSLRDGITEAISRSGLSHKFDVTVPPGELPKFLNKMHSIGNDTDGVRPVLFGHLGDGNIHVNMLKDSDLSNEEFIAKGVELAESIYTFVAELRGSISAEHGIGILKRPYLHFSRTPEEINMMRAMKTLWDPNNILNPGVLFEVK